MNLQNVTLIDRTSGTPVSVVFKPQELVDGVGRLIATRTDGAAVGQQVLTISGRAKRGTGQRRLSEAKLAIPKVVVETINGVPVPRVIDNAYVTIVTDLGPHFTTSDLENIEGMVESSLKTTQTFVKSVLFGRENVHG